MHSSTKPPVARLPRELYLAAIISNLLLFLKIYSTLSLDDFEAPLLQSISFFSPGINLQSSSTFSLAIPAAYSFSFVIVLTFYSILLILVIRISSAYLFIFNLMVRCRGLLERLYLFTLYALPLTILNIAFGSD